MKESCSERMQELLVGLSELALKNWNELNRLWKEDYKSSGCKMMDFSVLIFW